MIKLLLCLFLSLPVFSAVVVDMDFSAPLLKQGQLAETRIQIQGAENLPFQSLRGKTIGKTVYFYDLSPLVKRTGSDYFEATGKIIFVKVPEGNGVQEKISGQEINFNWGDVLIEPTEGGKSLIFGQFSVPEKTVWFLWALAGLIATAVIALIGWKISIKVRQKRQEKERLVALKNEILGCRNYDDVVALWRKKHLLFQDFPHIKDPFTKMEEVLNRHQFKPKQSETEKIEIVESYRKFTRSVEGGFNGI